MSYQLKLNCPICNHPSLTNLARHLITVHGISGQERKLYCEDNNENEALKLKLTFIVQTI